VKAAILVFTLILVIIFSAVWVSHGLDYALGFIVALGLVVFVGMPLFERYAKQESVVRREIHQLKEDNQ
jgi:Flp pilus assembly protein TadB